MADTTCYCAGGDEHKHQPNGGGARILACAAWPQALVECGCYVGPPLPPDGEPADCPWRGYVPISEAMEERELDTFDCPACGITGLLVVEHS